MAEIPNLKQIYVGGQQQLGVKKREGESDKENTLFY